MYKAVINTTNDDYIMHFNKNHSPHDGKFTTGDGDGDGVADDHHSGKKDSSSKGYEKTPLMRSKALPPKKSKLSKSSIFKTSAFNEYKDDNGKIDYGSYTKSGVKKSIGALGAIGVGHFLSNSDNLVASGVGYVTEMAGFFGLGYGATQTVLGAVNLHREKKESKS